MKEISKEELKQKLFGYRIWLNSLGQKGNYANLRGADLSDAYLYGADLSGVDLYGANLRRANLSDADLSGADLRGANLRGANLRGANLRGANLRHADLYGADIRGANLYGADLYSANLRHTDLYDTDLREMLNKALPIACPSSGNFIAWKKAADKIIKLEVCEDAKRSSASTRKCRCSAAKVLAIENIDGTKSELTQISSNYDPDFIYKIGEIVRVPDFDENRFNECAPGIHFFITREEAVEYF